MPAGAGGLLPLRADGADLDLLAARLQAALDQLRAARGDGPAGGFADLLDGADDDELFDLIDEQLGR
ncbi:hypothetical protein ACWEQL_39615 [Kitasatospora sp. NPDC004240]